jgi:NTE family protein
MEGGAQGARDALEEFWRAISKASTFFRPLSSDAIPDTPATKMAKDMAKFWNMDEHPAMSIMEDAFSHISPYQFNPLNLNPLRDLLEERVDFEKIHRCDCMKLFIAATNLRNGAPKIFENEDVTIDALLASACLPQLFQAVEIEGEAYWDGGYVGNPSLWPLFYNAQCRDILLVHVNPINRADVPKTMPEIENRLNEITFNAALLKELRSIDFVKKLIHEDMLKDEYKERYKDILLHAIRTDDVMSDLDVDSKSNTDWSFLKDLRDLGRAEAQKWLAAHFADIGKKPSLDIQKDYLASK